MEFKSKVKNKVLSGQSREIIHSVLKFMKEEAKVDGFVIPLAKVQERVAKATGVSIRTIKTIAQEARIIDHGEKSSFSTPNKKRKVTHTKTEVDDFDQRFLTRIIINFQLTEKETPSMKRIHEKFCLGTGYEGCVESLRKEVRKIGFRWRKSGTNRMEKPNIRHFHLTYLKNIKKFRDENRPIFYMDGTYIHASHTITKSWCDDSNDGLLTKISKGPRLIIVHVGGSEGFISEAYISWKSNTKTGDYHEEMNFNNYKKWVQEKLIPNLPPRSVLVIDNAPYHNKEIEKFPSYTSRKDEMQDWLRSKNIPFQDTQVKGELYELIKKSKPLYRQYEIDSILQSKGYNILRLPPYQPDLNPIEMVWASLKQYIEARNINFNITEVQKLCNEFFEKFSIDEWKKQVEYAIKCEDEFRNQEPSIDNINDDIFMLGTGDSYSDFSNKFSSNSDDSDDEADL